ncbi:MAG TPA: RNA polymerase sigma factor [Myxococcales bacterium]|nr:RNA polymerase sigma factor [Myxococcales bacterium]
MTDEMLADRSRRGSGRAFAKLVARHCDAVYRIAHNLCTSADAAEEITRQTFLSAYRRGAVRPRDASFRTWLYGIAVTMAMRQRCGAMCRSAILSEAPAVADLAGFLREALDCVDDDARAAFVLCDLVELPAEEAAVILRVSANVVRGRAHRVRLLVRGLLERRFSA